MKKALLLLLIAGLSTVITNAQTQKKLSKALELQVPREGGANAASVAWHPISKKYYASMAGNSEFFIGVYDTKGKLLSPVEQKAYIDMRGLWFNPRTRTLQMNGYNDLGWGEYILDGKGFPSAVNILHKGMNQPDEQSVGAYNPKENVIYFFNSEGNIEKYDPRDGLFLENLELTLGKTKSDVEKDGDGDDNYDVVDDYNSTSVVYTGIPGAEIGLLNYLSKEIELYNSKDGHLTRKLALPDGAPAPDFLNFAYCNNIYWLFDTGSRIWMGYK